MTEERLPSTLPETAVAVPEAVQPDAAVPNEELAEAIAVEATAPPSAEAPEGTRGAVVAPAFMTNPSAEGCYQSPQFPWKTAAADQDEVMSNLGPNPWAGNEQEEQGPT